MPDVHILGFLFFFVAFFYSLVGFGGASSYTALLFLFSNLDYQQIPLISLTCNIVVVLGNIYHFKKNETLSFGPLVPFLIASVPMAFLGGLMPVSKLLYQSLLGGMLLIASVKMLFLDKMSKSGQQKTFKGGTMAKIVIGGVIGFCSGMTGIGGGIILSPVLYFLTWSSPKTIAAACSVFILINSVTGISGHLLKAGVHKIPLEGSFFILALVVFVGGQLGVSRTCSKTAQHRVKLYTGLLLLIAAIRLQTPLFNLLIVRP